MATRFVFLPKDAEGMRNSDAPKYMEINNRPVLAFDAEVPETCYFTGVAPANLSGTITVDLYHMDVPTSGTAVFQVALEAVSHADALDLDSATSFASNNQLSDSAAATSGYMKVQPVTMTNNDSIAADDYFRIKLSRDASNGSDTSAGDCYVLAVVFKDAA